MFLTEIDLVPHRGHMALLLGRKTG